MAGRLWNGGKCKLKQHATFNRRHVVAILCNLWVGTICMICLGSELRLG